MSYFSPHTFGGTVRFKDLGTFLIELWDLLIEEIWDLLIEENGDQLLRLALLSKYPVKNSNAECRDDRRATANMGLGLFSLGR